MCETGIKYKRKTGKMSTKRKSIAFCKASPTMDRLQTDTLNNKTKVFDQLSIAHFDIHKNSDRNTFSKFD